MGPEGPQSWEGVSSRTFPDRKVGVVTSLSDEVLNGGGPGLWVSSSGGVDVGSGDRSPLTVRPDVLLGVDPESFGRGVTLNPFGHRSLPLWGALQRSLSPLTGRWPRTGWGAGCVQVLRREGTWGPGGPWVLTPRTEDRTSGVHMETRSHNCLPKVGWNKRPLENLGPPRVSRVSGNGLVLLL